MGFDGIDGDAAAMNEFALSVWGSLKANALPPEVSRGEDTVCDGGLFEECKWITDANNASVKALHEFITAMRQGLAAYSSFVQQSGVTYWHADDRNRHDLLSTLEAMRGQGLPTLDADFTQPGAPA